MLFFGNMTLLQAEPAGTAGSTAANPTTGDRGDDGQPRHRGQVRLIDIYVDTEESEADSQIQRKVRLTEK